MKEILFSYEFLTGFHHHSLKRWVRLLLLENNYLLNVSNQVEVQVRLLVFMCVYISLSVSAELAYQLKIIIFNTYLRTITEF